MKKIVFILFLFIFTLNLKELQADPSSPNEAKTTSKSEDVISVEQAKNLSALWYTLVYASYQDIHSRKNVAEHIEAVDKQLSEFDSRGRVTFDDLQEILHHNNPALSREVLSQYLTDLRGIPGLTGSRPSNPLTSTGIDNPFAGKNPFGQGDSKNLPGVHGSSNFNDYLNKQVDALGRQAGLGPVSGLGHWGAGLDLGKGNPITGNRGNGIPGGIYGHDNNPVTGDTFRTWASKEQGLAGGPGFSGFGGHFEERPTTGSIESGWGHAGSSTYQVWVRDHSAGERGGNGAGGGNGGGVGEGSGAGQAGGNNSGSGQARVEMGQGGRVDGDGTEREEIPGRDNSVGGHTARILVERTANHSDAVRAYEIVLARNPGFSDSNPRATPEERHVEADRRVTVAEAELQRHPDNHNQRETTEERSARVQREGQAEYDRTHPRQGGSQQPSEGGVIDPNHAPAEDGHDPVNPAAGANYQPAEDGSGPINPAGNKAYQPAEDGRGPINPAGGASIWDDQSRGNPDPNGGGFLHRLMNFLSPNRIQKQNTDNENN